MGIGKKTLDELQIVVLYISLSVDTKFLVALALHIHEGLGK